MSIIGLILLVILVLILAGSIPVSRRNEWGYGPPSIIVLLLVVVLVVWIFGGIPGPRW